jgi:molybdate transport system substrate-binding protein
MNNRLLTLGLGLCALMPMGSAVSAAEIMVYCSTALKHVLEEVGPKFEQASGHKLAFTITNGASITKRIQDGEAADVVMVASDAMERLVGEDKVVGGSRAAIARFSVGLAVRTGLPKPDISTPDALKRALLDAKSVAYTDPTSGGASGVHFMKVIGKLGIADEVKAKGKLGKGGPTGEIAARGDAEIAIQQIPELKPVKGIEIVGPLPPDLGATTTLVGAVHTGAKDADAARAFIKFLRSEEAVGAIRALGMEPA